MMNKFLLTLIVLLSLLPALSNAGGPLFVEGTNGNTPVRYQNSNIVLNFDLDMLAVTPTNAATDALVLNAINLWNAVTTSTISITQGTNDLPENVDGTNYSTYIPANSGGAVPPDDGLNPVIYDADGAIIDAFFGGNQSNFLAGFASSSFLVGGADFIDGYAVINGKNLGLTNTQTTLIVAHEIGHFIGLDHTLIDVDEDLTTGMGGTLLTACTTKANRDLYPLMFPVVCRLTSSLLQDDITSISTLYPTTNINQQLGQITGRFIQTSGAALLGANIWVQNTATNDVYSVVSDYLKNGTGFFSLYLPPGNYTVHANSIDPTFNGASSVGPYAEDANGLSFKPPHQLAAVNFEGTTAGSTEILIVAVGQATDIIFRQDGSGSVQAGSIFIPAAPVVAGGGGGGGSLAPVFIFIITGLMYLRLFHQKKHR